jgi:hypothetical protein
VFWANAVWDSTASTQTAAKISTILRISVRVFFCSFALSSVMDPISFHQNMGAKTIVSNSYKSNPAYGFAYIITNISKKSSLGGKTPNYDNFLRYYVNNLM